MKVLDPILWSNHNYSTPTFTTAAAVCLGCGLSLNITCETYNLHWALRVTCTIEMFVKMEQEANDMRSLPGDGVDKEVIAHGL